MKNASGVMLSRFTMEILTSVFVMGLGAIATLGSLEFGTGWGDAGPQPGYFPFYVGLIIILASCGVLAQAIIKHRDRQEPFLTFEQGGRILLFFGPMLVFVILAVLLGLYVALSLYLMGVMVFQGGYRPWKAATVGIGTAIASYVIFEIWFQVPLLKGPLEPLLGIH